MITGAELVSALAVPAAVSAAIAAVGRWRSWAWAMPAAVGAGFLAGYALLGMPRLPPRDGIDWLFWLAFPLTLLAIVDALTGRRWGWLLSAAAGAAALIIVAPLTPGAVSVGTLLTMAILLAAAGAAVALAVQCAEPRIGPAPILAGLCITLAGAAVVVLASHLRIVGIYGLAAAAALAPIALLIIRLPTSPRPISRPLALLSISLLAGLLASGRYYPEPGVHLASFAILTAAPALLLLGATLPAKWPWIRGLAAILAVSIAVAAVAIPPVLAAREDSEATDPDSGVPDPYDLYK